MIVDSFTLKEAVDCLGLSARLEQDEATLRHVLSIAPGEYDVLRFEDWGIQMRGVTQMLMSRFELGVVGVGSPSECCRYWRARLKPERCILDLAEEYAF